MIDSLIAAIVLASLILGTAVQRGRVKIALRFAWYDLWFGGYWDRKTRVLYVCIIPTLPLLIDFGRPCPTCPGSVGYLLIPVGPADDRTEERVVHAMCNGSGKQWTL